MGMTVGILEKVMLPSEDKEGYEEGDSPPTDKTAELFNEAAEALEPAVARAKELGNH